MSDTPTSAALLAAVSLLDQDLCAGDKRILTNSIHEGVVAIEAALASALQRIEGLQEWKRQQLAVESQWDEQRVGELLDLQPGTQIRPQIELKIRELLGEVEALWMDKKNLGMMMTRLARALKKAQPSSTLPDQAEDLFTRVGLTRVVIRYEDPESPDSVAKTAQSLLQNEGGKQP